MFGVFVFVFFFLGFFFFAPPRPEWENKNLLGSESSGVRRESPGAGRDGEEGLAQSMDRKGAGALQGSARTQDLCPGLQLRMRKALSG